MSSDWKIENPIDQSVEVHKLACCKFPTSKLSIIEVLSLLALNEPEGGTFGIRCLKASFQNSD